MWSDELCVKLGDSRGCFGVGRSNESEDDVGTNIRRTGTPSSRLPNKTFLMGEND